MALKVILFGGRKIGNGQNYEAPPSSIPGAVIQIHSQRNRSCRAAGRISGSINGLEFLMKQVAATVPRHVAKEQMLSRVAEGASIHAERNRLAGNPQKTNECGYGSLARKMPVQNTSGVSGRLIASNEMGSPRRNEF